MNTTKWIDKSKLSKITITTLVICIFFTLLLWIVVARCSNVQLNLTGIQLIHQSHEVLILFDIIPFIISFLVYMALSRFVYMTEQIRELKQQEKDYNESVSDFIDKLSKGEFDTEYRLQGENDKLGRSILDLEHYLKKNKEAEETRHNEDNQRNWATEGLAKFSIILRQYNNKIDELSYSVITNLVKYLNVNQGGFFILRETEEKKKGFDLTGCYAYGRKKYCNKRIEWGEGLIGECALEKESIFMTDVPEDYATITSGLGDSDPKCILIVPLLMNEEVQGVIEIASFRILQRFEIDFVERLAENIASTLYSVNSHLQTKKLLEQSQQQAEELAQQEEELRQNLEELRVTQEQIAVQSKEFEMFTNAVNHTMIRAEFDLEGHFIYVNENFINKLGYANRTEIIEKHISTFIHSKDQEKFFMVWNELIKNRKHFEGEIKLLTKQGKDIWTMTNLLCVENFDEITKIILLGIDITQQKEMNLDYEAQVNALNRSSLKAQFLPDGMLVECNDVFVESMKIKRDELSNKSIFDFISKESIEGFKEIWNKTLQGRHYAGQIKQIINNKEERWFQCTLTSVLNMYNEIVKIIYIANDITEQKKMEIEARKQADLLKLQEEQLKQSQVELSQKLEEAKIEMKEQFKEIERIKLRNEKTLEGAHDAIFTIDKAGRIEFFNRAAESLWDYSKIDIINKNVNVLFSDSIKSTDALVASLINGAEKIIGVRKETKIMKKNGEEIPVLMLLSEAKINDEHSFTAFIQNIEVELF